MKSLLLILLGAMLPILSKGQAISRVNFGTTASLPTGWIPSDTRVSGNTSSPSGTYSTPVAASGGTNVIFQNCTPAGTASLTSPSYNFTGVTGVRIGFGRRFSSASAGSLTISYSISGGSSVAITTLSHSNNSWGFFQTDVPALDNQSDVVFIFSISTGSGSCGSAPNTRIDDFTVGANSSLPINLKLFNVNALATSTLLSFSTATETNNSHFAIERSADTRVFSEIGQVRGAGTTQEPQSYTFTDEKPLAGTNYYRLRQVDYDGTESFSPVVSVVFGKIDRITLAPSPATDRVRISMDEAFSSDGLWQVYDNTGRQILSGSWEAENASYELDVNTLPEGMYTFRLAVGTDVQVKQFRKL